MPDRRVPDRVTVRWAAEDLDVGDRRRTLPAAELRRLDGLPPASARRSALAAVLLRASAAEVLGVPPSEVDVVRRCRCGSRRHGRPVLPGTGLHASVSHTRGLVGVALAHHPVGLDVEADRVVDVQAVAPLLSRAPLRTRDEVLTAWTRKESVLKATGEGLRRPLPDVLVGAPTGSPCLVPHSGSAPIGVIIDLRPAAAVWAAMTVLGTDAVLVDERCADRLPGPR